MKGLSYLHKFPVYHRDLKLGNILLKNDPTRPGKPIVKISDFGMSKHVEGDSTQTFAGTPVFMAPQIFKSLPYNHKCDLYSLGVMLYYFKTHQYPFGCSASTFFKNMADPKYPKYDSVFDDVPTLKELIQGLIVQSEEKRYDWKEIMENEYVQLALANNE